MKTYLAILVAALCLGSSVALRPIGFDRDAARQLLQELTSTTVDVPAAEPAVAPAAETSTTVAAPFTGLNITTGESPTVVGVIQTPVDTVDISTAAPVAGAAPPAGELETTAAAPAGEGATRTTFDSVPEALAYYDYLSTLLAAVQAAELASGITETTAWTILAPTNTAFDDRLAALGLTAQEILQPENRQTLTSILQLHIIPGGALLASQLTEGEVLPTALEGATVTVDLLDGGVTFLSVDNSAKVIVPDIRAGASVIHVINDVLLPAGVGGGAAPATSAALAPVTTATAPVPVPETTVTVAPLAPAPEITGAVAPGPVAETATPDSTPPVAPLATTPVVEATVG